MKISERISLESIERFLSPRLLVSNSSAYKATLDFYLVQPAIAIFFFPAFQLKLDLGDSKECVWKVPLQWRAFISEAWFYQGKLFLCFFDSPMLIAHCNMSIRTLQHCWNKQFRCTQRSNRFHTCPAIAECGLAWQYIAIIAAWRRI